VRLKSPREIVSERDLINNRSQPIRIETNTTAGASGVVAHDVAASNRVCPRALIDADDLDQPSNTAEMAAIETVRSRPLDALRAPGRPVTADPVALLQARLAFPREVFDVLVEPMILGLAGRRIPSRSDARCGLRSAPLPFAVTESCPRTRRPSGWGNWRIGGATRCWWPPCCGRGRLRALELLPAGTSASCPNSVASG